MGAGTNFGKKGKSKCYDMLKDFYCNVGMMIWLEMLNLCKAGFENPSKGKHYKQIRDQSWNVEYASAEIFRSLLISVLMSF